MREATDTSRMRPQIYPMPAGWITRAKRPQTRRKRLDQMLSELETGGIYMNRKWNGGV